MSDYDWRDFGPAPKDITSQLNDAMTRTVQQREVETLRAELAAARNAMKCNYGFTHASGDECAHCERDALRAELAAERESHKDTKLSFYKAETEWQLESDTMDAELSAERQKREDAERQGALNDASYCIARDALESTRKELSAEKESREKVEVREAQGVAIFDGIVSELRAKVEHLQAELGAVRGERSEERFRADDAENALAAEKALWREALEAWEKAKK